MGACTDPGVNNEKVEVESLHEGKPSARRLSEPAEFDDDVLDVKGGGTGGENDRVAKINQQLDEIWDDFANGDAPLNKQ